MKIPTVVSELLSGHDLHTKIFKGHGSVINESVVMVLDLGTLPNYALYLYQVSWGYPKGFQSYWEDLISLRTDRGTDKRMYRQTGGQGDLNRTSADFIWGSPNEQGENVKDQQYGWVAQLKDYSHGKREPRIRVTGATFVSSPMSFDDTWWSTTIVASMNTGISIWSYVFLSRLWGGINQAGKIAKVAPLWFGSSDTFS